MSGKCKVCKMSVTFEQQRKNFGRLVLVSDQEHAKKCSPLCGKCATTVANYVKAMSQFRIFGVDAKDFDLPPGLVRASDWVLGRKEVDE
jgi:hypothetical protein